MNLRWWLTVGCTLLWACGPARDESFVKLAQFSAVSHLQASAAFVYFTEAGALKQVSTSGGVPTTLIAWQTNDFVVSAGQVYAATALGVYQLADQAGASPAQLSPDVALAIAADADGVSWSTCTWVTHAARNGQSTVSTALPVSACSVNGSRLVVDRATAYGADKVGLWYAPRGGGPITRFSSLECTSLAVGSGWAYCGNADGVWRVLPATGRNEQRLVGAAHDLAADGDRLFVALGEDLLELGQSNDDRLTLGVYANITAVTAANGRVYLVNTSGMLGLLLSTAQ